MLGHVDYRRSYLLLYTLHARRKACTARSPLAGGDTEQALLIVLSVFGEFVAVLCNRAEIVLAHVNVVGEFVAHASVFSGGEGAVSQTF
jgi:hypothetical protein